MTIPPSLAQPSFSQAPIETTDPNAISKTIMDAKGDLISATGADTPARLAVGTDGQVLIADSTQTTGLKWAVDPTTASFDAKGDLLVGTGPDAYTRVPVGTNNQVLVADSAEASGVRWSSEQDPNAITKSIIDAKGDLIAGTAADTPARLAVGSDGQYLIADSTQTAGIKWATPNITLGTETTGNYVAGITGGTGVTVTGSGSEGATPSVAIGQAVGTGDTVAFGGLNVDSGTLYVDSTNNRVGINDTTPSYSLDVTGDGHFSTDLTVDGTVYAPHIHGDLAGLVYTHVKNTTASLIPNGTPVYATGTVGSTQVIEIAPADASNSAKMPAIGITDGDIAVNANGHVVIVGDLDSQNTNAYTINQPLYVASGGGLTGTRPTGASDVIQVVGHVSRVNTNTGGIVVACGPSANTPNTISVTGNISTSAGYFSGSGSGLTNIPAGQLTGTVPSGNIGNDSVALGTKTTGDYVQTLSAGTGVTVTNGIGEGSTPTVAIGQAVATTSSPQFVGLTATGTVSANAVSVTNGVGAASATITGTTATSVLTVDGIEIDTTGATSNQVLAYNGTKFAPSSPGAAAAGSLTGTTLASNVVSSSLTSVGTLGSLAVTGDLTVDTIVLKVDTTNNRVGINCTPQYALDVLGALSVTSSSFDQDGIRLQGRSGGSGNYDVILTPTTLSATRTLTLPDETGTVALTSLVPAGCIMQYGASSAPSGWLLCDGSAVSRSTYATLFAIISTTYGSGDGSTTFNLPNLKGRVPVGRDAADTSFDVLGETGGAKTHTLTSAESGVPAHTHPISDPGHFHSLNVWSFFVQTNLVSGFQTTSNTGVLASTVNTNSQTTGITVSNNTAANASSAHNNLQPYIVLNYIIKT